MNPHGEQMKLHGASGTVYELDMRQEKGLGGRVLAELWQGGRHLMLKIDDVQATEADREVIQAQIREELRRMRRLQSIPGMEQVMVPIVDHGEHRGRPFYLMPHMPLRLSARMNDRPGLGERLAWARALAQLLHQLQTLGSEAGLRLSHRDIKPDNLYIDGPGLRLGDWGACRLGEEDEPASGEYSEGYAPLDQVLRLEDTAPAASWDVHAVAAVVVELLTGDPPRSITYNRLYRRSGAEESRELHRLARTDKMLSLHLRDQEELGRALWGGLPEGEGREGLARRMVEELLPPLRKALHPDPRARSTEPAALLRALERCEALMARPPRETRWARGAGLGLAALSLLALGEWPPRRDAVLEIEGLPEWVELEIAGLPPGQAHRWQELRPGPTGEARRRLLLPRLASGQELELELVGRLRGTAGEEARCGFRAALPVAVGLGFWDLDLQAPALSPPTCPSAGLALSLIPAGPVWVGPLRWGEDEEASWETANADEGEGQELLLEQGLLLAQTEVTQALWERVAALSSTLPPKPWARADWAGQSCTLNLPPGSGEGVAASLPVHCISFCEALAFANALSVQDGLLPVYGGLEHCPEGQAPQRRAGADGWRLPTALEWTRAARGDRHHLYAGLAPHRRRNLPIAAPAAPLHPVCGVGNIRGAEWGLGSDSFPCHDGQKGPAPVASYSPNAHGLYDMTGNVSEWVWDLYSALPASRDLIKEDRCTAERGCRQLRGGSWGSGPDHARIGNIAASLPGEPVIGAGLRLARDISKTRSLP